MLLNSKLSTNKFIPDPIEENQNDIRDNRNDEEINEDKDLRQNNTKKNSEN